MIGEKTLQFQGKGTDLGELQGKIQTYLQDGFTVQTSPASAHGTVLQAKKGGWLEGIIAADRALTVMISGDPRDFTVRIGIGKWLEHLGVTAVETLLLAECSWWSTSPRSPGTSRSRTSSSSRSSRSSASP